MNISLSSSITRVDDVLCQEVAGETVLLDLQSESYFSLDAVGTRVWQLLEEYSALKEIYEVMLNEYDVKPDQLEKDLKELVTDLANHSLLKIDSS